MGLLIYEDTVRIQIEDRTLSHLQTVVARKLRRSEPFLFTWLKSAEEGSGRISVWMHPAAMMVFRYYGKKRPSLNAAWIEILEQSASSAGGLQLLPEPQEPGTDVRLQ